MILVHRLKGEPMLLNSDLIESIETTPDTVITMIDGRRFVVGDTPEDIVEKIRTFRASVLAATEDLRAGGSGHLVAFPRQRGEEP